MRIVDDGNAVADQASVNRKLSDYLIAARQLVDAPPKWTKTGPFLGPRWCVDTAIWQSCNRGFGADYHCARDLFREANSISDIPRWNDEIGRTHTEMLAAFDRAIAVARAEEEPQRQWLSAA